MHRDCTLLLVNLLPVGHLQQGYPGLYDASAGGYNPSASATARVPNVAPAGQATPSSGAAANPDATAADVAASAPAAHAQLPDMSAATAVPAASENAPPGATPTRSSAAVPAAPEALPEEEARVRDGVETCSVQVGLRRQVRYTIALCMERCSHISWSKSSLSQKSSCVHNMENIGPESRTC